ncbi:LAMI_0G16908g1_1 [Lachancea mirantina]|uniref:non-specific serine/threonine protein kinase n=1 Tax=Lachancea mirantina TaxID=1230905 RepID=A0A1G4KCV9_9SACH|nr:LAMI_0G16908g1_1 [Lachancea mirantina]
MNDSNSGCDRKEGECWDEQARNQADWSSKRSSSSSSSSASLAYDEYLKVATDKSLSILLELDMNGKVKYLSSIWEKVVGTKRDLLVGQSISDFIMGNENDKSVFYRAVDLMVRQDCSYRVRFMAETGPLREAKREADIDSNKDNFDDNGNDNDNSDGETGSDGGVKLSRQRNSKFCEGVIELEGQGTVIYNKNLPSHSMWILKPFFEIDEMDNLPQHLVERLGFGAAIFSHYLSEIEEEMVLHEADLPTPKTELCRVCDSPVPAWWLETHSELCIFEHTLESNVQFLHDELVERKGRIEHIVSSLTTKDVKTLNYRGLPLPSLNSSDAQIVEVVKTEGEPVLQINTGKLDVIRSLNNLSELCDSAININTSELSTNLSDSTLFNAQPSGDYDFSPKTKENIEQVNNWGTALDFSEIADPGLKLFSEDTMYLAHEKVEALLRLDNTMKYSLKIKREIDNLVLMLIGEKLESNRINALGSPPFDALRRSAMGEEEEGELGQKMSTFRNDSTSKIASPLPQRPPSGIFAKPYVNYDETKPKDGDSIVKEDSASPLKVLAATSEDLCRNYPTFSGEDLDEQKSSVDDIPTLSVPPSQGYPKLNNNLGMTPMRGSPLLSFNFNTPLSSLHRNSASKSQSITLDRSPITSPFATASDCLTPEIHLNSGVPKQPLSPLLLATNQAKSTPPSIKDYDILKPISKGAYGSVYLAKRRLTGEYYAVKVLKKSDMIAKNQVTNVKSERAIMMVQSNKSYVAKLFATFQNKGNLFLVMEYLSGGDLSTLIKMMGCLPNQWAKQYISEVIYGVNDMHQNGIIHHDLKPDNLLIDAKGHVKLTDFGLSRMGLVRRHQGIQRQSTHSSSRKNSIVSEEASPLNFVKRHTRTDSPHSIPSIENSMNKKERSESNSSSQSALDVPHLNRSASQVSFSMLDVSRSGSPQPLFMHRRTSSSVSDMYDSGNPDYALFHPEDSRTDKKFFGTPDYFAPETIEGSGESVVCDWWSVGCMLFEFLLGYPPFHAPTVEEVFSNILSGNILWPEFSSEEEEREQLSPEAKDLIKKLLVNDPQKRLGANGFDEIRQHPYFEGTDWDNIYDEDPSFVPTVENPESTDYFDLRGAALEDLSDPEEGLPGVSGDVSPPAGIRQGSDQNSGASTPGQKMTVASVLEGVGQDMGSNHSSPTTRYIPLAIPPHLRERRVSKLNELQTEFGSFNFRNLPALDKANKDAINRLKSEHIADHHHNRSSTASLSSSSSEMSGKTRNEKLGLLGSPGSRESACLHLHSPSRRGSEDRGNASRRSIGDHSPLTPSSAHEMIESPSLLKFKSPTWTAAASSRSRLHSRTSSIRSVPNETLTDDDDKLSTLSRSEGPRGAKRTARRSSSGSGPCVENLDVLICEPIPIHRYKLTKDLEGLGCSVMSVGDGDEMVRRATSGVKFDLIFTALKLPKLGAVDIVRLLRNTNSINCKTPIMAVTGYYHEAQQAGVFDDVLERPVDREHLRRLLLKFSIRKPPFPEDSMSSDTDIDLS